MGTVTASALGLYAACTYTVTSLPLMPAVWSGAVADSVGVCNHLTYPSYTNRKAVVAQAIADLGLKYGRTRLYTQADGDAQRLWMVELNAATGITFNVVMGNPTSAQTPAQLVTYLAKFPEGVVSSVEGANEWNLSGRAAWVSEVRAHQQALWAAMKASPVAWIRNLPVLAPALGQRKDYDLLGDLSAWCDVGNTHCYPNAGEKPSQRFDACITGLLSNSGATKPFRFTEVGYNTAPSSTGQPFASSETSQGLNAPKVILELFRRGCQRSYLYEMLDEGTDGTDAEDNFGLLRFDGSRKPAFTALQAFLSALADPGPSITPPGVRMTVTGLPADGRSLLAQKRDGSAVLFLWRDVPVYDVASRSPATVDPVNVTVTTATRTQTIALSAAVVAVTI